MKKLYLLTLVSSFALQASSFNDLQKKAEMVAKVVFPSHEERVTDFIVKNVEKSASYKKLLEEPESTIDFAKVVFQEGLYSFIAASKCFNNNGGILAVHYKDWFNGSRKAIKQLKEQREVALAARSEKSE